MKLAARIAASIGIGTVLYTILLLLAIRFPIVMVKAPFLLWNLRVLSFVGRGDPVGYMPNGAPIYDGSVGFLGVSWPNILLGFLIYPIIVFAIITFFSFLKNRNN